MLAAVVDHGAHVEQVSVRPAWAGRRLGAALIEAVAGWGRRRGLAALTLTTFSEVPWNRPYYARLGFAVIGDGGAHGGAATAPGARGRARSRPLAAGRDAPPARKLSCMIARRLVTSSNPTLAGLSWPVFEARGERDGPRMTLMSGIHGCEYPAIAAVRRFMRELDTARLSGSIVAVPFASPTSFTGRSAFVVPEDGKNINRGFPGAADGSFTDALADHLFREFIVGADLFIDLHGGDLFEALEPFAIYQDSPQRETAAAIARAFNFPYVIVQREGGLGGMTSWAAAQAGIPAVIAEVGGCGLLEAEAVEAHLAGVHNALRAVGMLEGPVTASPRPQYLSEDFRWMRCRDAGWWQAEVTVGEMVQSGQRLGAIQDPVRRRARGDHRPAARGDRLLTTSPAVTDDGLLLAIAGELSPL